MEQKVELNAPNENELWGNCWKFCFPIETFQKDEEQLQSGFRNFN